MPNTDVIQISYQQSDSQLAIAIVNSLMKNYSQADLLKNRNQLATLGKSILQQISQKEQELKVAEKALWELKEQMHEQRTKDKEKVIKLKKDLEDTRNEYDDLLNEYEGLLRQLQEVRIGENQNIGHARILRAAHLSCSNF